MVVLIIIDNFEMDKHEHISTGIADNSMGNWNIQIWWNYLYLLAIGRCVFYVSKSKVKWRMMMNIIMIIIIDKIHIFVYASPASNDCEGWKSTKNDVRDWNKDRERKKERKISNYSHVCCCSYIIQFYALIFTLARTYTHTHVLTFINSI